jgi:alkylation response protein AidB-like acyl-CoA dehydrogenase
MAMDDPASGGEADAILKAAIALAPEIKACRDEIERGRRLPLQLVDKMKQAGVFRMPMPRAWGGPELDPVSQLRVIEALSLADASVGWCAMIGCDGGYFSSFLDQAVAREMYRDLDAVTAGALTLTGRAERVKGGYRVSGRWPFCSGCQHASWIIGGCFVHENGSQKFRANGVPESRQCLMRADEVEILDTWYTTGLRGSGSHDTTCKDVFVPEERTFSFQDLKRYRRGGLYSLPLNILYKFAGPALGVARAAIDALIESGERPSRLTMIAGDPTPPRRLRDEQFVQDALGRAEAMLGSARSYLFDVVGDTYDTLEAGRELSPRQFARFDLVQVHVFALCAEAVQTVYKARGGSAVYSSGVLDRYLRDALTMNEHTAASNRLYGMGGRILLGLPPELYLF